MSTGKFHGEIAATTPIGSWTTTMRLSFDRSWVEGSTLPDFVPLLAQAGLVLRAAAPQHGWIGVPGVSATPAGVTLATTPVPGSPLDAAGLEAGDRIIAVNGAPIVDAGDWTTALDRLTPGATVTIRFANRDGEQQRCIRAVADPRLEIVRIEQTGATPSARQRAFRAGWING